MATIHLALVMPSDADWRAAERELIALIERYGLPEDWQPHLKKEAQAELSRITKNLADCMDFKTVPAPGL